MHNAHVHGCMHPATIVNCVLSTPSLGAAQHHCSVIGIRYGIVGGALLVGQGYRYSASGMGGRRNS